MLLCLSRAATASRLMRVGMRPLTIKAFSSEANTSPWALVAQYSGFSPKRSRTSVSERSAWSHSAKANMPVQRVRAASSPQWSMAASRVSVSEWPRHGGGVATAASSAWRTATWL